MNPTDSNDQQDEQLFSVRDGITLPMVYKGHQITVNQSNWTPRERIWVDDVLVFDGNGWTMKSKRRIEVDGEQLEITLGFRRFLSEFFVEARKDGELVAQRVYQVISAANGLSNWTLFSSLLAGAVFGYLVASWLLD
jgi:hypothetical protein